MKTCPLSSGELNELAEKYPTPFYLYDEAAIRKNAERFKKAFSQKPGFQEFFAVKACPNPFILKILADEGFGMDCSSLPELLLAERSGVTGEKIMFTSNDTPAEEFVKGRQLGAILNLDDISHIPFLEKVAGLPELVCLRYNPGPGKVGNSFIGQPVEAKYGLTGEQMFQAYELLQKKGVKRFGLHTMVVSNELQPENLLDTAQMLFTLAAELYDRLGIAVEFINLGGGIGIPYRPEEKPVNLEQLGSDIYRLYDQYLVPAGLSKVRVFMECGRMITGPYGWLVSRVRHIKKTYKNYAGLDACMANLMRPGMYGAYHHLTVPGKETAEPTVLYDVTGSLCENIDKFAVDRLLPELTPGDLVVLHDVGAHGYSMGFQYNGKLRSAELLLREDGSVLPIRRPETPDDYFATLDWNALEKFGK